MLTTVAWSGLLAGCDIPTSLPEAPILDVKWVVPSQSTSITVANLIPGNVSIAPDGSGFLITPSPSMTQVTRTLAQECPACAAANGLVVPKPAFVGTASMSTQLPTDFSSATLVAGNLQVVVNNGFNFDPLRPSAAAGSPPGVAVIVVANGTTVVGRDSVNGATTALPAGGSITRNIALGGLLTGGTPLSITVTVNSPAGDPVLMDASRPIVVAATSTGLKVASANIIVAGKSVSSSSTIDLTKVDSTITNRVRGGALLLTVANPFTITGTLTVQLAPAGTAPITKTVQLGTGSTARRVEFTEAELRRLLGRTVTVSYTGTVNSTGGPVLVTPQAAVLVTTRLELDLRVGG